ncbi:Uncharacterised protein [Burkholderia pseudomallei]|nr:hypothetical protein X880_787 [Burkholderia pseudomallei MSHR4032]CAJ3295063.1 Uncharacterised protein [Burkholderia pseudomallei]CAJ3339735.1 Uncharacterised protein [Burkholderia pseudomallei]CAJ3900207.1 Uncharacterised protein [Burkholderia pseudomallei]CAJ4243957.1 Uncharacterised protein [Burkholderia pseudomallei]
MNFCNYSFQRSHNILTADFTNPCTQALKIQAADHRTSTINQSSHEANIFKSFAIYEKRRMSSYEYLVITARLCQPRENLGKMSRLRRVLVEFRLLAP